MTEGNTTNKLTEASPSVQTHLGILQGIIERTAANSTAAKTWCITLVSAILVVVAEKEKADYAFLALVPTLLFLCLDTYYLMLEKGFRNAYESFVRKLHNGTLKPDDLYAVRAEGLGFGLCMKALRSFSVWGFYLVLLVLIVLARVVILAPPDVSLTT